MTPHLLWANEQVNDKKALSDLLKACDDYAASLEGVVKDQQKLLEYRVEMLELQQKEIKRLRDSRSDLLSNPVFWGLVGVLAGGLATAIVLK